MVLKATFSIFQLYRVGQFYFSGGNRSTRRKPLTNFIINGLCIWDVNSSNVHLNHKCAVLIGQKNVIILIGYPEVRAKFR
jgi:hypothetical protein